MNIFARAKCTSPSEFKCDQDALIFREIRHDLSEVCELYNVLLENIYIFGSHH